MESKILGLVHRLHSAGHSKSTSMVSSPITLISFQQIFMSSYLPKSPKNFDLPKMITETRHPVQVSISTSQTQPKRQPSFKFITSFSRISVIQQFIKTPLLIIFSRGVGYYIIYDSLIFLIAPFSRRLTCA